MPVFGVLVPCSQVIAIYGKNTAICHLLILSTPNKQKTKANLKRTPFLGHTPSPIDNCMTFMT